MLYVEASGGRDTPEIHPLATKRRFARAVQAESSHCAGNARHCPYNPRIVSSFGRCAKIVGLPPIAEKRCPHSMTIIIQPRYTAVQSAAHAVLKPNIPSRQNGKASVRERVCQDV